MTDRLSTLRYGRSQYRPDGPPQMTYSPDEVERDLANLKRWREENSFLCMDAEDIELRARTRFYGDRKKTVDHPWHGQFWYIEHGRWRYDAPRAFISGFVVTYAGLLLLFVVLLGIVARASQ